MSIPTVQEIGDTAAPIARDIGVTELYVFGSMANGTATEKSDIDFIYAVPETADLHERARMSRQLHDALRTAFHRDVDLVRKTYLITPKQDELADFIRRSFLSNINTHNVYQIV